MRTKRVIHYTEGIKGCGQMLELKVQHSFFALLRHIYSAIEREKQPGERKRLLRALEWKFTARDFQKLNESFQIFKLLLSISRDDPALLMPVIDADILNVFRQIFFSVAARATESEDSIIMKLKTQGQTQIPSITRSQSILSSSNSEQILAQAYNEIFRQFNIMIELFNCVQDNTQRIHTNNITIGQLTMKLKTIQSGDTKSLPNN